MKPLVDGAPAPGECWDELAEHSLTHDDLPWVTAPEPEPAPVPSLLQSRNAVCLDQATERQAP